LSRDPLFLNKFSYLQLPAGNLQLLVPIFKPTMQLYIIVTYDARKRMLN